MAYCPECGAAYPPEVVACPRCRVVLGPEPEPEPDRPHVVHRVPDAAAGALLCGVLEHAGIPALLKSATLPGYGGVRRDWATSAWGEILVSGALAAEAKAIIADYLQALEAGGQVRDDDVESADSP
jgi:hypothetical protein